MRKDQNKSFPPEIIERLKNYVYRLIDPRNGETFYVGRGVGNRLFSHVRDELGSESDEFGDKLNKLSKIREIGMAGFSVAHVIHRHGLSREVAKEIEAALIDAYPGLTNIAGGEDSGDRGVMHADEILNKFNAMPAVFKHRALLISVNRSASDYPLYEATRFSWKLGKKRIAEIELVLSVQKGLIRGVFVPHQWLDATEENFPGRPNRPGRVGFVGSEASMDIADMYLGRGVPEEFKFGSANPIRYT